MLTNAPVTATIRVTDLEKAKDFYMNKLGLKLMEGKDSGDLIFEAGEGTKLYVYEGPPSKAENTQAGFTVSDVEKEVDELSAKGVVFEKYDMPMIKTNEKGIATIKSAIASEAVTKNNLLAGECKDYTKLCE